MTQSEIDRIEEMVEELPVKVILKNTWGENKSLIVVKEEYVKKSDVLAVLKSHLLSLPKEEEGKFSSKHDATIFFRDADKWKTLYEELQTQLSQETKRREAAEKLIEVTPLCREMDSDEYAKHSEAYQSWQSLKSQHETVVEDGKEDEPTTAKEGDGGLNLTTTTL